MKRLRRLAGDSPRAREALQQMITRIPDELARRVAEMYFMERLSWREVAQLYGWKDESSARNLVKRYFENELN